MGRENRKLSPVRPRTDAKVRRAISLSVEYIIHIKRVLLIPPLKTYAMLYYCYILKTQPIARAPLQTTDKESSEFTKACRPRRNRNDEGAGWRVLSAWHPSAISSCGTRRTSSGEAGVRGRALEAPGQSSSPAGTPWGRGRRRRQLRRRRRRRCTLCSSTIPIPWRGGPNLARLFYGETGERESE